MSALASTLSFIVRHPLNRHQRARAIARFVRWQVGSRLLPGPVAVPFVNSTRLLVARGMTGATQNIYCGLHEFEDMAFVLHAMRSGDLFVDVGANVGTYTVLAAGAVGARCLSFEPGQEAFRHLVDNVRLNDLESVVRVRNVAVGASSGLIAFSSGLDTMNHALAEGESRENTLEVCMESLDAALSEAAPTMIKIDVEGYETDVLRGGTQTFGKASLVAVLVELNGSGRRYGHDDKEIHQRLLDWGFSAATYVPQERSLLTVGSPALTSGNTLYVRNVPFLSERLRTAPRFRVGGTTTM